MKNNTYLCGEIVRSNYLMNREVPTLSRHSFGTLLNNGTMPKIEIKKGERYGRLIIIKELSPSVRGRVFMCQCDCGQTKNIYLSDLRNGHIKSCGCLYKESRHYVSRTHGESNTRLYKRWGWIKNRCYNPNTKHYSDYGGRGIILFDKWFNDVVAFINYCKSLKGWNDHTLTLDRIDNNGNYEPGNLRFVTRTIQSRNRRIKKDNKTGYVGVTIEVMPSGNIRYRASIGVNNKKITIGSFRSARLAYNARCKYITENNLKGYNIAEKTLIELVKDNK